jgi:hypothetical protein
MMVRRKSPSAQGFTLAEILIALGIFAVAVTGLLVLLPIAHRTEREGIGETRATLIAGNIMDALFLSPSNGTLSLAVGTTNGTTRWEFLNPEAATNRSVAYDASCEPIQPLEPAESRSPVTNPAAEAVATLNLSRKPALPSMTIAEVTVSYPASAPADGRTVRRFVRLIPMLPHE